MRNRLRFAFGLALLLGLFGALAAAAGWILWLDLDVTERGRLAALLAPRVGLALVVLVGAAFALGAVLRLAIAAYPGAARRMREEVGVIHSANPSHHVALRGAPEMRQLATAINTLADARLELRDQVDARVAEANARLAQEKNRLAALMSELSQSVLVCNADGRILLYNAQAAQLLEPGAEPGSPVGLGRSVFGILDKGPIVHALDSIRHRLAQQVARPVARFVAARRRGGGDEADGAGQLLRAQMAPVLDADGGVAGFVLILEDITRAVEQDSRRDELLRQLTEGTRASVANIRAAAETLQQFPQMDEARRTRFTAVLLEEAQALSARLDESLAAGADDALPAPWPREDMLAADLVFALQRGFEAGPGVTLQAELDDAPLWLSLDSHAIVQALTQLMARLVDTLEIGALALELRPEGRFARLTLAWDGAPLDPAQLHAWEDQPFTFASAGQAATLKGVLARHGGEIWSQPDRADGGATGRQRLCVQLPTTRPERVAPPAKATASRPVYYDFDLFNQPGQRPELDDRPLAELACTVFDTETTGLAPSEGDEIISIGAVRIVNGRLLEQESFDRLIQPRRAVRPESQKIHGITPAMLVGQPPLEQVLPLFARFAEDTVLVAHNAAFDMRFLQVAEARTGLRFDQPVLDTLLLSALVHPGHEDEEHRLEQIAARLGIAVVGRHTALGDAIATGEVFLRLVPLLAERGIHTLRQAREASRKTAYAKLEY